MGLRKLRKSEKAERLFENPPRFFGKIFLISKIFYFPPKKKFLKSVPVFRKFADKKKSYKFFGIDKNFSYKDGLRKKRKSEKAERLFEMPSGFFGKIFLISKIFYFPPNKKFLKSVPVFRKFADKKNSYKFLFFAIYSCFPHSKFIHL